MKGWRKARLEEVADVLGGGTPSRQEAAYFGGQIAWATPTDVTSLDGLYISTTKENITEEGLRNSSTKLMPPGSVLLTSRATIGYTAVAQVPICTNQGFVNFVCRNDLMPEFLAYWLQTQKDKMLQYAGGTTFKEIARGTLRKFEISFPAIEEQRRIVDLLSRAEGIVRLRREAQKKAAETIPALFLDMFGDPATNPKGWPIGPLGEVLAIPLRNGVSPSRSGRYKGRVLTLSAITGGVFDESALKEAMFAASLNEGDEVSAQDFLVCRGNGNKSLVGIGCFPHHDMPGVTFPDTAIAVRPKFDLLLPRFLAVQWQTVWVRQQIEAIAKTTNGTFKINQVGLSGVKLILPSRSVQCAFDERIRAFESIIRQQANALKKTEAAFESVLARAFSNDLAAPEPVPEEAAVA